MGLFDFFKRKPLHERLIADIAATPRYKDSDNDDGYGSPDILTMVPNTEIQNDHFVNHKVTFDKVLRPGEKDLVEWQYAPGMTKDQIETIIPACGCTANVTWGNVGVRAVFTHQEKAVPEDGGFYSKNMTVYFKDGLGMVPDGRGGMMYDPNKKRRVLTFTGKLMP